MSTEKVFFSLFQFFWNRLSALELWQRRIVVAYVLDIGESLGVALVVAHTDTAEPLVVLNNCIHVSRNLPYKLDVPPLLLLHTQRRKQPTVRLHDRVKVAVLDTLTPVEGADGTEHFACMCFGLYRFELEIVFQFFCGTLKPI